MPQDLQQLLLNRPAPTPDVQLPTEGKQTWLDQLMHKAGVATGLSEQRPGDGGDAIAAMAGLFPMGKLLKFFKKLPAKPGMPQLPSVRMPHEFHPMPETGTLHDLPQIEIDKAIDLSKPRPHLEGKGGNAIHVSPPPADETSSDKIWRVMQERKQRRANGLVDPRVPKKDNTPPAQQNAGSEQNIRDWFGWRPSKKQDGITEEEVTALLGEPEQLTKATQTSMRNKPEQLSWNTLLERMRQKPITGNELGYISDTGFSPAWNSGELPAEQLPLDKQFMFDVNTSHKRSEVQRRMMEDILDRSKTPYPRRLQLTPGTTRLWNSKQVNLPTDVPMISYHPDLPFKDVEAANKYVTAALKDLPSKEKYVGNVHLDKGGGGGHNRTNSQITVGIEQPSHEVANTIGHEFQHAFDAKHMPEVFKNYPYNLFSGLLPPKPEYFTHPSEVRARAAGNLFNFGLESNEAGQNKLPPDFLQEVAIALEKLSGEKEKARRILWDKSKEKYVYAPYQHQPNLPLRGNAVK